MTLYLKYRSQTLDELDLTTVRESLKKIVESGNIPHAFLFAGPKGTGKTSSARILAKIINCVGSPSAGGKPCNKCEQCKSIVAGNNLDVIELDAASHRGIDDIRSLRDGVKLAPTSGKKKIYIIDEAHMLTTEASNALLKTLEEPPDHVVFILATTNPEKILDTIKSRALVINFNKATTDEVVRSLKRIVHGEKLKIDKEILELIGKASDGSFRDGAKGLEQILAEKKNLDIDTISEFLFHSKEGDIVEFIETVISGDTKKSLQKVEELIQKGVGASSLIDETVRLLREELLHLHGIGESKIKGIDKVQLIHLIELLTKARGEIANSFIEQLPLEMAIIEWGGMIGKMEEGSQELENEIRSSKVEKIVEKTEVKLQSSTIKPQHRPSNIDLQTSSISEDVWKQILSLIKPINASVEALLRSSKPISLEEDTLKLGVFYKFHKERLEDTRNKKILEDTIGLVLGKSFIRVTCILTEPPVRKVTSETIAEGALTESKDQDIIKIAEDIFGN